MSNSNHMGRKVAPRIALTRTIAALALSASLLVGCSGEKPIGQQIAETANKIPGISVTYEDAGNNDVSSYSPAKPDAKIRTRYPRTSNSTCFSLSLEKRNQKSLHK